jgi:hypothetical protein
MALSEAFTGSATIGATEFSLPNGGTTLTPRPEQGVFQVFIDTEAMSFGDQYTVRIYEKITSGGGQRQIYEATLTGVMADSWVFPSLLLMHGWDVTIQKRAGTDRVFAWSLRQVA